MPHGTAPPTPPGIVMPGIRGTADMNLGRPELTGRTAPGPEGDLAKAILSRCNNSFSATFDKRLRLPQSSLVWAWICSWLGIPLSHLRSCWRRHEAPRIPSKHASFAAMLGAHQPLSVPIVVDRSRIAPRDRWVNPEAAFRD